ncbi:hypothetical protein PVW53_06645 [Seohaeicola sp. SP36]|uniref:hypothetical protein n=1 Tax=unclassified Seohaeicola TaxID=2641111 RepID=UPI00237A6047|nr:MULTISPECIES: hypothetical protein [unclassified Seohaeicola]MDD9706957.1 hypothetical protein [Seohaeicola sp. 4SK31]MDD9735193.1 hypothetical protein [Seohaeicola sp. SP36]
MQTFANGQLPKFDNDMVQELADAITKLARRAGGRGMRVNFAQICAALDDNEELAAAVLNRAGFKHCPEQWATGKGNSIVSDYTYPAGFSDALTEILDRHDSV